MGTLLTAWITFGVRATLQDLGNAHPLLS